jgi:hypothetical protein
VAEQSPAQATTFVGGFEFARRLRDPQLREALRTIGWESGQPIVMTTDAEPVVEIVARVSFHEVTGRALIVMTDDSEPRKFRIMAAVVAHEPMSGPTIELGPDASIGMLYSALHPCGNYMPSEWMQTYSFERLEN